MPLDLGIPTTDNPVLACLDHGHQGYEVLCTAVHVARANHRPLLLLHVVREVEWLTDPRPYDELLAAGLRRGATLLADAVDVVTSLAPALDVSTRLVHGSLFGALTAELGTAWLIVVGAPAPGRDAGLAACLETLGGCPVLVAGHPVAH